MANLNVFSATFEFPYSTVVWSLLRRVFFICRIRERLFDFDDWNSYAITHFLPYYLEASFDAQLSSSIEQPAKIDLDDLGGRLEESLR